MTVATLSRVVVVLLACSAAGCVGRAQSQSPLQQIPGNAIPNDAAPGERFYILVFGSERTSRVPRYTHTWATVVKTVEAPGCAPQVADVYTISWMPATLDIRPWRFTPEPGRNLELHETLRMVLRASTSPSSGNTPGGPMRMAVFGLDWPTDKGEWLPLVAGRPLGQNHYEMLADKALGLALGERVTLGKNTYTVVGITSGMVTTAGDGLGFFTISDAQSIQDDVPGEAMRLERAARPARARQNDIGRTQPQILERAAGPVSQIPALSPHPISSVMVTLEPGADTAEVVAVLSSWPDVAVYTREEQRELMLTGIVDRQRRQIGMITNLLLIVSAVVLTLIVYTLTLERMTSIALLKLIGAPDRVILGMVLQQALLIGGVGYGVGYLLGQVILPYFPRRVVLVEGDLLQLGGIVAGICLLGSLLGMWKAARVSPNEVLS